MSVHSHAHVSVVTPAALSSVATQLDHHPHSIVSRRDNSYAIAAQVLMLQAVMAGTGGGRGNRRPWALKESHLLKALVAQVPKVRLLNPSTAPAID